MFFERLGPAWESYRGELRRKVRVLVVDDEEMVRELLMEIVRLAGYEVEGCSTGERALERLREAPFDLLLTDKNLPGVSGIELVAQVRAAGLDVPAVVITGYPSGETLAEALTAGAADYISKPFDLHHVKARIGSIIDQRLSGLFYDRMVSDLKNLVRDAGASRATLDQIGVELFRFKRALSERVAILIVEANPRDAASVRDYVATKGGVASILPPEASARAILAERPLVVEVSLGVPGAIDLVRHLRSADPLLEVIASGRPARLDEALEAVAAGASDYVLHSEGLPALGARLGRALSRARRQQLYLHLIATLYRAARRLGDRATVLLQDAVPASQRETLERLIASVEPPEVIEEEIDLGDLLDQATAPRSP